MLLRRISTHVKEQNWFAVFLDFFIVVVGVFIGIQVANWNEQRALKAQERSYLILVQEEVDRNYEQASNRFAYYVTVVDAAERTLAYLEGDEPCADNCGQLLVDAFHASQFFGRPFSTTAYEDAVELGFPSNDTLRQVLTTGYTFLESGNVNDQPPALRPALRRHISPEAIRVLWANCWRLDETTFTETLMRDCEVDLPTHGAVASMERMKSDPELAGLLRLWISQIIVNYNAFDRIEAAHYEMKRVLSEEIARK